MSIRRNAIAYVALFVALGGTSYAASELPANTVGTRQLKDGAVTNAKVRAHSLSNRVFARGVLPSGLKVTFVGPVPLIRHGCSPSGCPQSPAGSTAELPAICPTGETVLGGGYYIGPNAAATENVIGSRPTGTDAWEVIFETTAQSSGPSGEVYAICAQTR